MNKFIYRMQSILDIKYKLEEQEKTNYSIAKQKLNEEEDKMNALIERKNNYEQELRLSMQQSLILLEIRRLEDGVESLKVLIKVQAIQVKKAEQVLEAAVARLNQAMRERKVQEKLKEQAWEEYKKEFEAEEQKQVDELVSFTYGRVREHENS